MSRRLKDWAVCQFCGQNLPPFIGCPCRITEEDKQRAREFLHERLLRMGLK